ncbi:hypothetical protein PC9H_009414 [Pleurotus ostreatus]|uniref:GTP-binding protein n=2 Tax=Pleurotus ostreatus TaxID=5322 RepID=A0A8H6ZQN2_PLEOS|nr:uncharacterized protein PC9H_009414 [Pleurotus ostreatus]KAF7424111.1 hypothetical protein PC9H_009414 [Pleurotus ostreatus]
MANYSSTSASSSSNLNNSVKRTKILLLGLRRSGKTSIQQVLFNDLSPKQTFYLEPTMRVVKHAYDTLIPLEIWDCPGNITVDTLGAPLSQFSSIIFVIDIRDLYNQAISKLVEFIVASYHQNPNINFEVFVHKAEKLQEDDKIENFRQIHERVSDRLLDISSEEASYEQVQLNFHLTSVYDHSLHEAFSRVLHKLVDSLPYLEDLLNGFCANSQSPKAFLFDISSRLYIATDASPVDSATHNLCCDYLGMINAFGPLYRSKVDSSPRQQRVTPSSGAPSEHSPDSPSASQPQTPPPTAVTPTAIHSPAEPSSRRPSASSPALASGRPFASRQGLMQAGSNLLRPPLTPSTSSSSNNTAVSSSASSARQTSSPPKDLFYPSASTTLSPTPSASTNHSSKHTKAALSNPTSGTSTPNGHRSGNHAASSPNNGTASNNVNSSYTYPNATTLTYHALTPHLALLALLPSGVYEGRRGLVEWNVVWVREGVREIWEVEWEGRGG